MKQPPTIFSRQGVGDDNSCVKRPGETQRLINHFASSITAIKTFWMDGLVWLYVFQIIFYQSVFYSAVLIRGSSLGSTETFFPSVEVIMILFSSSYKPRAQAFSHRSVHPCQCQSIEPGEREPWLKMIFHLGLMIIDFLPCFVRM